MKKFKVFLEEQKVHDHVDPFVDYACDHLGLDHKPKIILVNSKKHAQEHKSFGGYYPGDKQIKVNIAGRHTADILRTLAHELVHHKQNIENRLKVDSGETGSDIENEANAQAAVIMRNYGKHTPAIYESVLNEVILNTIKPHNKLGMHDVLGKEPPETAQKIGTLDNGHHVWHDRKERFKYNAYYVTNPRSNKTNIALTTQDEHGGRSQQIGILASNKNSLGAHHLYHHLVTQHGIILTSDDQSEGGRRVWAKAAKMKGVHIHGFDPRTGTAVHHDPSDEEGYVRGKDIDRLEKDASKASEGDAPKYEKEFKDLNMQKNRLAVMHKK